MDQNCASGARSIMPFLRLVLLVGILTSGLAAYAQINNSGSIDPSSPPEQMSRDGAGFKPLSVANNHELAEENGAADTDKDEQKDDKVPESRESSKESEKHQITEPGAPAHRRKILLG